MWDDTVVVVTADHGEQLGDQGLMQKLAFFESSYRDPRHRPRSAPPGGHGTVVERFTENVDIMPTLCEAMGIEVPAQCDGYPLTPFLDGERARRGGATRPTTSGTGATSFIATRRAPVAVGPPARAPAPRRAAQSDGRAYVQFGDGSWRCFDLAADPTWRTEVDDPARRARRRPRRC